MKQEILAALLHEEGYVSGQELCDRFQVSRTAVWKVINQLKEEGYEIESVSRKGYRLVSCPDCITPERVGSMMKTQWAGSYLKYFDVIGSTNNEAKRMAEQGAEHGMLVLADCQQSGKGRRGRAWSTPPGTSIAMSLIVRPPIAPDRASMMTLVMGMAVAAACREVCQVETQIKWPNDIVSGGKKICGILTEMSSEPDAVNYLVIGTGINVNLTEFPEELTDRATSLTLLTGTRVDRAALIASCMEQFERYYATFVSTQDMSLLQAEYNSLLAGRDAAVRVLEPGNEYNGIARGINERGELLVERENKEMTAVYAGEVSVRGIYGYIG
jgi:BirA family biotin operon repressor/biotin-[acetyl-CoA-carboxylase] ligase